MIKFKLDEKIPHWERNYVLLFLFLLYFVYVEFCRIPRTNIIYPLGKAAIVIGMGISHITFTVKQNKEFFAENKKERLYRFVRNIALVVLLMVILIFLAR